MPAGLFSHATAVTLPQVGTKDRHGILIIQQRNSPCGAGMQMFAASNAILLQRLGDHLKDPVVSTF